MPLNSSITKLLGIISLFVVILFSSCLSPNEKGLYVTYIYGQYYPSHNPCKIEVKAKYGFEEVLKGPYETKKDKKHNAKVDKKLLERNGYFWRVDFEKEMRKCPKVFGEE